LNNLTIAWEWQDSNKIGRIVVTTGGVFHHPEARGGGVEVEIDLTGNALAELADLLITGAVLRTDMEGAELLVIEKAGEGSRKILGELRAILDQCPKLGCENEVE
jgi:hypothetical protein